MFCNTNIRKIFDSTKFIYKKIHKKRETNLSPRNNIVLSIKDIKG